MNQGDDGDDVLVQQALCVVAALSDGILVTDFPFGGLCPVASLLLLDITLVTDFPFCVLAQVASLLLLEKESKADVLGKNNLTPLHVAVHCNHPDVATLLLDHNSQ